MNSNNDFEETQMNVGSVSPIETIEDVNKYREIIPYNTTDPKKISQQESILELLITNGICNDETFQIFIAEPDSHKERASKILDSLYCVNTMIPESYDNEASTEWVDTIQSASILLAPADNEMLSESIITPLPVSQPSKIHFAFSISNFEFNSHHFYRYCHRTSDKRWQFNIGSESVSNFQ